MLDLWSLSERSFLPVNLNICGQTCSYIANVLRCERCGRYDSKTDTWTIVAPINSPRDAVGVCVLGDKLYAVGGYDGSMYRHDVEAYDPQTNEWTKVSYSAT